MYFFRKKPFSMRSLGFLYSLFAPTEEQDTEKPTNDEKEKTDSTKTNMTTDKEDTTTEKEDTTTTPAGVAHTRKEKFLSAARAFEQNSQDWTWDYLVENGFGSILDDVDLSKKRRGREYTESQAKTIDEAFTFLREFAYDVPLLKNEGEPRSHRRFQDRPSMFEDLKRGPDNYVSMFDRSHSVEGEKERSEKQPIRDLYRYRDPDLKRAGKFGGSVESNSKTEQILSNILPMKLANTIQRAAITADAHRGRLTIQDGDLVMAHIWDGYRISDPLNGANGNGRSKKKRRRKRRRRRK
jgi:hypothetical protein